jgi:hypothetical protein
MSAIRRWVARSLLGLVLLAVALLVVGVGYEQWSRFRLPGNYPPPGQLITVDGRTEHLYCIGQGEPTVILETGFTVNGSLDWYKVQPPVSRSTKVCSYDRAGILWSKAPAFAAERDELLGVAGLAAHTQKAVLEAPAFQVRREFLLHVPRPRVRAE